MKSLYFVPLSTLAVSVFLLAQSMPAALAEHASPQSAPELFQHPISYASGGSSAMSVAVADLNGDGIPDVVVANQVGSGSDGSVGVLINNGNSTFQPTVAYDSGGSHAWSVAIADVNADGKPDIIVMNAASPNTVGVLLGHGDGTFAPAVTYNASGFTVSVADVNGDGKLDIVTGGLDVLLGNGDGTFLPAANYGPGSYASVADVNGDGKPDLVALLSTGGIGVLINKGDGTFQPYVPYSSGGVQSYSIAVADVNGDGKPDIAVSNYCVTEACVGDGSAAILLNNGDGTFQSPITYDSGARFAQAVALADVNGDGNPDLIVGNYCEPKAGACPSKGEQHGEVSVLLGNGTGTFGSPQPYLTPNPVAFIAVADINGGRPDLVLASDGSSVMALYGQVVATTTSLTSSLNPVPIHQSVTFTATTTPSVGQDYGGETVTFYDGATILGTGTTDHGVATLTTSFAQSGKHKIKADFPKGLAFKTSSGKANQVVTP